MLKRKETGYLWDSKRENKSTESGRCQQNKTKAFSCQNLYTDVSPPMLLFQGFITPSGFVKCTLLEFNMFRQWIRKLKLDRIHQEGRRQRQIEKQQWKERLAREQLLRDEELYSIVREREQKARELIERGKKRREADRRKYIKLEETDRKRREKHQQDMKRRKDMNESKREKDLAKKQAQKIEEDETVCNRSVM